MPLTEPSARHAVSVVIPVRNYGLYLGECLDSVLAQTLVPSEVIVVDDHSEDGSLALAQEYAPAVRAVPAEGAGASSARNTGIRMTRSDLIAFLDADDRWLPHALECMVTGLDEHPEAGFTSGRTREFISPELAAEERQRFSPRSDAMPGVLISAALFRRPVFDHIGSFDETLAQAEVIDLLARCQDGGVVEHRLDSVVAERRLHPAQLTKSRAEILKVVRATMARRRQ
jgi:glycosyltransferase involved in cell wall biosynthesis